MTQHATELLDRVWSHTLATDWVRRERNLRADIVSRTSRLASHGWAAVLRDLGRNREWVGDGHLRINSYDLPSRRLEEEADLFFIPVHGGASWVGWDIPRRYAVYYPVTGALARVDARVHGGLARLVGENRAAILVALGTPSSTSHLVAHDRYAVGLGRRSSHGPARLGGGAAAPVGQGNPLLADG